MKFASARVLALIAVFLGSIFQIPASASTLHLVVAEDKRYPE